MKLNHDIKYGDWIIHLAYSHVRGDLYGYHHDAFDGPGDDRCGIAYTIDQAVEEINDWEAENVLPQPSTEQAS